MSKKTYEFTEVIAAGRFDASLAEAKSAWDEYRRQANLIVGTEYGSGKFDPVFEADGWDHFRGSGEAVIAWDKTFKPAWADAGHADRIGSKFYRGGNKDAQTPVASIPLRHVDSGRLLMVRVPHMPAHVQAGGGFRKTTARVIAQVRGWITSLAVLGKRSRRFRHTHKNAAEINSGDWNVDVHSAHWRGVVARGLGLRCAKPLPPGGDIGGRLVTWAFVRGVAVVSTIIMNKRKGYDHRPVRIRFKIKES